MTGPLLTIVGEVFEIGQLAFFFPDHSRRPFLETIQLFQEGLAPSGLSGSFLPRFLKRTGSVPNPRNARILEYAAAE